MTTVVVGIVRGEEYRAQRMRLRDAFEEHGFATQEVSVPWPCNHFTFFDGRYISKKEFRVAAVGGTLQFGDGFVIAAKSSFTEEGERLLKQAYDVPIHPFPTGKLGVKHLDDIDLYTLLAPRAKLLVIDGNFFENKRVAFEAADEIADRYGLSIEEFTGPKEKSFQHFPLNARVVQNGHEKAFVGFHSPALEKILGRYGVEMIVTDLDKSTQIGGSARCVTNLSDGTDVIPYLDMPPPSWD